VRTSLCMMYGLMIDGKEQWGFGRLYNQGAQWGGMHLGKDQGNGNDRVVVGLTL
jgi:hypothetical protein